MEQSLHVCTVASHRTTTLEQLERSCKRQGITLDILGLGQPFKGMAHKFIYVQKYLEELPKTDIVLFVDAYDVLILEPTERILNTFLSMKTPFVVSAEPYCNPYSEKSLEFPESPTSLRYINSGLYIGYVWYIKELLNDLSSFSGEDDDQGLFILYYLKHPEKMVLDRQCELFLNTYGFTINDLRIDIQNGSIECVETATTPCIIHGQRHSAWYQYIYDLLFSKEAREGNIDDIENKTVLLAILVKDNADVLQRYLETIDALDYNKKRITSMSVLA